MSDIVSKVRDLAANCDGIKLKYLITLIKKVANDKVKLTDDEKTEVFNLKEKHHREGFILYCH